VGLRAPCRGSKQRNICPSRELNPSQLAIIHLLVIYLSRVLSDKSAFVVELDSVRWKYAHTNYVGVYIYIYIYIYALDGPGSNAGGAIFSVSGQTGSGAHSAPYTMGTWSFPVVKRPGRDVDHLSHRLG
jgi:hypothetical protein